MEQLYIQSTEIWVYKNVESAQAIKKTIPNTGGGSIDIVIFSLLYNIG